MVLYRGKYVLEGLDAIPPDMLRDLDMAYDICSDLKRDHPCHMCGKCCNQPFITVRDEEVERVAAYNHTDPLSFVMDYLERDDTDEKWLFRETEPCHFLTGKNRCKMWGGRPEICDEFPYMVSTFMSRVYLAIVNDCYEIDLSYMDDTWPCTKEIKDNIRPMIREARERRKKLIALNS
jgi:Fe-S-cluster containining protein